MDRARSARPRIDYRRAVIAAGAGACGVALALASTYSAYVAFISGATSLPQDVGATVVQAILLFAFPLVFSAVGGGLVMMALGVRGVRTFVISLAAFMAGAFIAWAVILLFPNEPYQSVFSFLARAYLITVSLIVVLAVPPLSSLPISTACRILTAIVALLLLFLALVSGSDREVVAAAVIGWIMLPALLVLGSSRARTRP